MTPPTAPPTAPQTQDAPAIRPQDAAARSLPGPQPQAVAPHASSDDPIDPLFTDDLMHGLAVALPTPEQQNDGQHRRRIAAAVVALRSLDAQQPVEAMLATQAVLAHHFTMECYRRAARSSQTPNLNTRLLGTAAMLSRTMGGALHTLERRQREPVGSGAARIP